MQEKEQQQEEIFKKKNLKNLRGGTVQEDD